MIDEPMARERLQRLDSGFPDGHSLLMSSNPEEPALSSAQALAQEYDSLRPGSGYRGTAESDLPKKVHREQRPFSALCISGGGIRSATFALGAIQGLAEQGILGTFDYLSTVSGGGYIGAWLTSWKQRQGGLDRVIPYLRRNAAPVAAGDPDPIQHLREYNSYLSPKAGFFSVDTWTLGATVVRNMFLNWLVFVPLLMLALLAPRLILSFARLGETYLDFYGNLLLPLGTVLPDLIPAASGVLFAVTVFNIMRYLPGVGRKPHSELAFLKWVLLPAILASMAFITNDSWFTGGDATRPNVTSPMLIGYTQMVSGVMISALAGWLAYLVFCGKPFRERVRLFPAVTSAVLLTGWSAGSTAWYLANFIYPYISWPVYINIAPPLLILALMVAGCFFVGFTSRILKDDDREWLSRAGAWSLLFVASWTGVCALVLLGPTWAAGLPAWGKSVFAAAGAAGGWASALAGSSSATASSKSAAKAVKPALAIRLATALAPPAFGVAFMVGLAIATDWLLMIFRLGASSDAATGKIAYCPNCTWWNHRSILEGTRWEAILLFGVALWCFAWLMARYININKFSLHEMYRSRLIRAYLGAANNRQQASQFTGFAESDNLPMHQLDPAIKPFQVVNVTLNLVAGERLAWQQRKAESFTITPLHCGSANLGYRPSAKYGGPGGITLGTAITISGAAASPNMGYNSSAVIGFIMTLFNARLGAWLGNPGKAGNKSWRAAGPTSAVGSLVKEAFGLTNDTNEWVYLSDGGHFENLALYEMVRRRCRHIVVLDGGCDPDFRYGDLGNALRKIRIDMKIPIDFEERGFGSLHRQEKRYAIARIGYSAVDDTEEDGFLVYIKPMMRGNEPPDVLSYQSRNSAFPHQSTADQFFDESQTESYRELGLYTLTEICRGWDGAQGLPGLVAYLSERLRPQAR